MFFLFSLCLLFIFLHKSILSEYPKQKISIFLILFWIFFLISATLSPYKELSRNQTLFFLIGTIFYIIGNSIQENDRFTLKSILCGILFLFLLFFLSADFLEGVSANKDQFFLKPNFVTSIALVTFFLGNDLRGRLKKFSFAVLILSGSVLLTTKSLAGTLSVGCGVLWSARNHIKETFVKTKVAWVALTLVLLLFLVCLRSWKIKSFEDRIHWWSMASSSILKSPLIGSGPGSFEKVSRDNYGERELRSPFVHNFPLQIASECGIFASFFLVVFILDEIKKSKNTILAGGALALFLQNLFDYSLNIAGFFLIFLLLLGLGNQPPKMIPNTLKLNRKVVLYFLIVPLLFWAAWDFGFRPLNSFNHTLKAQEHFEEGDLEGAQVHLREAMEWDKNALDPILNLSELLSVQAKNENSSIVQESLLKESLLLEEKALKLDPTALRYKDSLKK